MQAIFDIYGWNVQSFEKIDQGLINATFTVKSKQGQEFILQSINHHIFKNPEAIDHNISMIGAYLNIHHPNYTFTHLIPNLSGATLSFFDGKYYRAFVKLNGRSYNVLSHSNQVKEAAAAFGNFTSKLADIAINEIQITLPNFHNLSLRYQQFETSLDNGDKQRIENVRDAICFLKSQAYLVEKYEQFIKSKEAIKRVTHHDTKISNVLFDEQDKAICVIDLDTVMPGYFISDVGDMCRTYLPNVSEEEANVDLIKIDKGRWMAIKEGYLENMGDILTSFEMDHFEFAGQFMIYMQALRFLTDHLNRDKYYGAKYNGQNYVRAINQIALLEAYNKMIH